MTAEQLRPRPAPDPTGKPAQAGPAPDRRVSKEELRLRAELAQLRAELAGTVDQLAGRLNVRKQAEQKLAEGRAMLVDRAPILGAVAGAGLFVAGALVVLRIRKKRRRKAGN